MYLVSRKSWTARRTASSCPGNASLNLVRTGPDMAGDSQQILMSMALTRSPMSDMLLRACSTRQPANVVQSAATHRYPLRALNTEPQFRTLSSLLPHIFL